MKRAFTLLAALMLFAVLAIPMGMKGQSFSLVSSLDDLSEGTYCITALNEGTYYTVPNTTINAQTFTCTAASYENEVLTPAEGYGEFILFATEVINAFYIYNTNLQKYLVATGSKKFGYVDDSSSDFGYWTFSTVSSGGFSGAFSVQHNNKTQYMRAYSNSVRCYDGQNNNGVYLFVQNSTSGPSISASNVEIAYDATGGEIAYSINNPVAGSALTASTQSDWLENVQVGTSSVTFNCDPNQGASARTATVTLSYPYDNQYITKNVTVTQAGNPDVVNTISEITAAGNYTVQGTIVAINQRGFILGDGTGYVYYYYGSGFNSNSEYSVDDIVKISGEVSAPTNYKVFQFGSSATITEAETSNYQTDAPTAITGADMDAVVTGSNVILSSYVQYEGTLTVSGTYYNITGIDGASTAKGSISYPTNTDFTSLNGKNVIVKGYYVGVSSSQYYNTMLGTIEEVVTEDPYITIPATASFEYGGGFLEEEITYGNYQGTPELDVVYCDANGDPVTAEPDWMSANAQYHDSEDGEWYMLEINCGDNGGAVRTAYLKVTDGTVSSNVMTITQEANPDIIMTIAEVRAAEVGTTVKTQGLITSCVGTTAYMQDDEAAICVYGTELVVGYEYTVEGTLTLYKGLLEITDPTCQMVTEGNDVIPEVMTIAFINADYASDNAYQGWLVKIEEATVTAINSQNVTIEQIDAASAEPATITVRFASADDITFAVNDIITLTGNIGCFNGVQIANPRDIEVQENTNPSITLISDQEVFVEWNNIDCNLIEYEIENPTEAGELLVNVDVDWIEIEYIEDNSVCFKLTTNEGTANRVGIITLSYEGAENVTVTVTQGYEIVPGDWELVELEDLEEGDVFVIVGTTAEGGTYAMTNDNGTSAPAAVAVTIAENTLAGEIAENLQWNITGTPNGYTFYPNGTTEEWLYCTNTNNGVKVGTNETNNIFTVADGYLYNNATSRYVGIYNAQDWRCYKLTDAGAFPNNIKDQTFAYYKRNSNIIDVVDELIVEVPEENDIYIVHDGAVLTLTGEVPDTWDESHIIVEDGGELFHDAAVPATLKKDIVGYNGKGVTGYYLVAAPVYNPFASDYAYPIPAALLSSLGGVEFDLYMFDESAEKEWLNYKDESNPFNGNLHVGVGYLFSYNISKIAEFPGMTIPTSTNFTVKLQKTTGATFSGLNLVGNPYTATAFLADGRDFYVLNDDGDIVKSTKAKIEPVQGLFVVANNNNEDLIFTTTEPSKCAALNIDLSQNNALVDVASINFNKTSRLEKFQLNPNHTKIFFSEAGKDYASIDANSSDAMTLNFKAEYDGTYTINVNTENIEMGYLHLIDNMTGADIDLLANPSYSFEAKTTDYASRFRLVFSDNSSDNNENFAFFSNGNIIVNGEGTLQVIDITGRVISTEQVNGISSVNVNANGVYVLQLVNGSEVKTQKIVVK